MSFELRSVRRQRHYRRKPPNQQKLGGDFHVLTRWATTVVTNILPLTETEPTILTNRHRFGTDGCVAGKTNRHVHLGSLQQVRLSRACLETTTDQSPIDATASIGF